MTNAVTKQNQINLDKTLLKQVSKLKDTLQNISKNKDKVLLCDVSGSMSEKVSNEARAIDIVRSVIQMFPGSQLWTFSTSCCKVNIIGEPESSTNMAGAFQKMKAEGFKEIYLLTDGEPDSRSAALNASIGLKINIIYIGPQPTPQFLKDLANSTNGRFEDIELIKAGQNAATQLEAKVRLMLNA